MRNLSLFRSLMITFTLSCLTYTSCLCAAVFEDEKQIEQISDTKSCLTTLRTIMREKIREANTQNLEHAQAAINDFFTAIDFWKANPSSLTTVSWDLYPKFAHAYFLLENLQPEDEQFTQYGFKQGSIDEELNVKFLEVFQWVKSIPFICEDCDPHYLASKLTFEEEELLNKGHTFVMLEDHQQEGLKNILSSIKKQITDCVGSYWKIASMRAWKTSPTLEKSGPNSWHQDGLPSSVLKIMYYPLGADSQKGTLELRLPSGIQRIEGKSGTWVLFKPSDIFHRGIPPEIGERIAIEITIIPSLRNDITPVCAGQNARHPHLPWKEALALKHFLHPSENLTGVNIGGGPYWTCANWVNLEEVKSPANPNPYYLYPNCRFPIKNESIEIVYSSHSLEHFNIPTVFRVLSEANRVLKEDGNLIIKIPDYDKALACWRNGDSSFFDGKWNIESLIPLWRARGLYDCLDYRAAMIFCSFFNDAYGNPFGGPSGFGSDKPYFGPPVVEVSFLRGLIRDKTPGQIAQALRSAIAKKESNYHFVHQSAWSREELQTMLNTFGFDIVSFDPNVIERAFGTIPRIHEMKEISTYCLAKKRKAS